MGANIFKYSQLVADNMAFELFNALKLANKVDRRMEANYKMSNPLLGKVGPTITAKKTRRYIASNGLNFQPQAMADQTFQVTIDQLKQVGLSMDVFEQTYIADGKITERAAKDIKSAANTLADQIDLSLATLGGQALFHSVGVPGTIPGSVSATDTQQRVADARAFLTQEGVPTNTPRMLFGSTKAAGYIPASLSGLFVREAQEAVTEGRIGTMVGGVEFYESANIFRQVAGTAITAGTIANGISNTGMTINGGGQTGTTLNLTGGTAGRTFNVGDVIYAAGCYNVNVVNKQAYADLHPFTVTAAAVVAGDGTVALSISPEIITAGSYQNVSASPTAGATVYGYNTATRNFLIVPETLALVCLPYEELKGGVICNVSTYKDISIMLTVWADGQTLTQNARVDCAYGVAAQYPETGVLWMGE